MQVFLRFIFIMIQHCKIIIDIVIQITQFLFKKE
jgi:hypothetical protein